MSGRLTVEQINISLIQAPWAFRGRIKGLEGCQGSLFYCISAERYRTCVYTSGTDATPIPPLCSMDVVAVLETCKVYGESRMVAVCSAYLPHDSVDPLQIKSQIIAWKGV
jgi:hypothetical protein